MTCKWWKQFVSNVAQYSCVSACVCFMFVEETERNGDSGYRDIFVLKLCTSHPSQFDLLVTPLIDGSVLRQKPHQS